MLYAVFIQQLQSFKLQSVSLLSLCTSNIRTMYNFDQEHIDHLLLKVNNPFHDHKNRFMYIFDCCHKKKNCPSHKQKVQKSFFFFICIPFFFPLKFISMKPFHLHNVSYQLQPCQYKATKKTRLAVNMTTTSFYLLFFVRHGLPLFT